MTDYKRFFTCFDCVYKDLSKIYIQKKPAVISFMVAFKDITLNYIFTIFLAGLKLTMYLKIGQLI